MFYLLDLDDEDITVIIGITHFKGKLDATIGDDLLDDWVLGGHLLQHGSARRIVALRLAPSPARKWQTQFVEEQLNIFFNQVAYARPNSQSGTRTIVP